MTNEIKLNETELHVFPNEDGLVIEIGRYQKEANGEGYDRLQGLSLVLDDINATALCEELHNSSIYSGAVMRLTTDSGNKLDINFDGINIKDISITIRAGKPEEGMLPIVTHTFKTPKIEYIKEDSDYVPQSIVNGEFELFRRYLREYCNIIARKDIEECLAEASFSNYLTTQGIIDDENEVDNVEGTVMHLADEDEEYNEALDYLKEKGLSFDYLEQVQELLESNR